MTMRSLLKPYMANMVGGASQILYSDAAFNAVYMDKFSSLAACSRSTVGRYIEGGEQKVAAVDVARIVGDAILIEPSRTNECRDSYDAGNMASNGGNLTRTTNETVLRASGGALGLYPDGTGGGNWIGAHPQVVVTGNGKYSVQVKVKRVGTLNNDNRYFLLGFRENTGFTQRHGVLFDLQEKSVFAYRENGTTSIDRGSVEDLGNGVLLLKMEGASIDDATYGTVILESGITTSTSSWVSSGAYGDGTAGIAFEDFQFEFGEYCSSYIYTDSASAVTRGADDVSVAIGDVGYNKSSGCLKGKFKLDRQIAGPRIFGIGDEGSGLSRMEILMTANGIRMFIAQEDGTTTTDKSATVDLDDGEWHEYSFGYADNDFVLKIDGAVVITDTSASALVPRQVSEIFLGRSTLGGNELGGLMTMEYYSSRGAA